MSYGSQGWIWIRENPVNLHHSPPRGGKKTWCIATRLLIGHPARGLVSASICPSQLASGILRRAPGDNLLGRDRCYPGRGGLCCPGHGVNRHDARVSRRREARRASSTRLGARSSSARASHSAPGFSPPPSHPSHPSTAAQPIRGGDAGRGARANDPHRRPIRPAQGKRTGGDGGGGGPGGVPAFACSRRAQGDGWMEGKRGLGVPAMGCSRCRMASWWRGSERPCAVRTMARGVRGGRSERCRSRPATARGCLQTKRVCMPPSSAQKPPSLQSGSLFVR